MTMRLGAAKLVLVLPVAAVILSLPLQASGGVVSLLNNGGFEANFTYGQTIANAVGKWATGDPAAQVGAENGVTPFDSYMLKFTMVGDQNNFSDDVYQVIDLNAYASQIDTGLATIHATAYFASVSASSGFITLFAAKTLPTTFADPAFNTHLAQQSVATPANKTWKLDEIDDVKVPVDTRYLFFGVNHTAADPNTGVHFPTTYADNAGLLLTIPDVGTVPEPGVLPLAGLALGALAISRRRKVS
jgi:hypothetical protein